jgi:hypothetical protein
MVSHSAARVMCIMGGLFVLYGHVLHGLFGGDLLTEQVILFGFICLASLLGEIHEHRNKR